VHRDIPTLSRPRRIGHASAGVKVAVAGLAALLAQGAAAQDEEWIGRSYRSVLTHFAGGQTESAYRELLTIESRQADSGAGEGLLQAERRVINEVAGRDPQALPALVLLHHEAFLRYRQAGRLRLAAHALRVVVETTASSEMRSAPMPVRRAAGLAMTSLAGAVVGLNLPDAVELLRRAIDLDPLDPYALLAFGAIHEKLGSYPEAVGALQRCLAIAPTGESRLRLAINLRRTGAGAAAEPLLAETARGSAKDGEWIAVLASQELAALLAEQGRPGDAVARLREAITRHPGDGTLRIQLSYLLERSGDPAAALAVAEEAARRAVPAEGAPNGTQAPSPRLLYNRWPRHVFEEAATAMRASAEPQVPRLAPALGAGRGAGG
jgi:tetratricopeptide (TPR) repeat protein